MNLKLIAVFSLVLLSGVASGQAWERVLSGGGQDEAQALARTPDGGYVLAGIYGGIKAGLVKTDADGNIQWTRTYLPGTAVYAANAIIVTSDSGFVVAGATKTMQFNSPTNIWVMKTDFAGNVLWQKEYGGPKDDAANGLALLPDGNIVMAGFFTGDNWKRDIWYAKINPAGDTLWTKTQGQLERNERANDVIVAANGDLVFVGENEDLPDLDLCVLRTDGDGNTIWENSYGFDFVPNAFSADAGNGIAEASDGGLVIAGKTTSPQGQRSGLLMKIAGDGSNIEWHRAFPTSVFSGIVPDAQVGFDIGGLKESSSTNEDLYIVQVDDTGNTLCETKVGKAGPDIAYSLVRADDGGIVVAGSTSSSIVLGDQYIYLSKTIPGCTVYTNYLAGNVFHDFNLNCTLDPNEPGFKGWVVKIESADFTRYATTQMDGSFSVLVDTGLYTVSLILPNNYWELCNTSTVSVPIFAPYDTATVGIGVRAARPCPQNLVHIKTPILRRCAENTYTVRYCNAGTIASVDTRVEITLDPYLQLTGASIPWQSQNGNTYSFNIGYLNNGDCGDFALTAWLNCDSTEAGQAHCVKAHIFPDSFCNPAPLWDGSLVEAGAYCENGIVKLNIKNQGTGAISNTLEYIVIEDEIMRVGSAPIPNLPPNKDTVLFAAAATGHTYRIVAQQSPGYPGISYPTAAVEGCQTDTTTSVSYGFYTMFAEDDADAFLSADCQESYEADFNPTFLKRGHPKGFDDEHFIDTSTVLDFLIRFSNVGQDTIGRVIVRDTLSEWLDPSTIEPGAASHAYDFEVYGGGIVQFTIPNSNLLPGSSAGEAASSGYVQFRVAQRSNTPCGTEIFNRAAIYFDFNAPVQTNETFNTVCPTGEAIFVKTNHVNLPGADVKVSPNPFVESTRFEVTGVQAKTFSLEIFDVAGKKLIHQFFNQPTFRLYRHQLPAGILFYRLAADGRPVASGKLESLAH